MLSSQSFTSNIKRIYENWLTSTPPDFSAGRSWIIRLKSRLKLEAKFGDDPF